jgi:flagellar hook-associated protein 3 FlgL
LRVSERQRFMIANKRIDDAKTQNIDALKTLSTQKRINALHDDPVGATRVIKHTASIADQNSFQQNIAFSKGFLEAAETAVTTIADGLGRVQELAIAMANDTYAIDSRQATAKEIGQIMNQIVQMGNSKFNGRYVFSGFRTNSPALDADGVFLGDDGEIFLQIGKNNYKSINVPGRELFEASPDEKNEGHLHMVEMLQGLKSAMEGDDKASIYRMVDELSFQINKATSFQASVGAIWNAIEHAGQRLEFTKDQEIETLSKIEDADIYEATSQYKRVETMLQSTLLASNKFLQPSLLNFLQ